MDSPFPAVPEKQTRKIALPGRFAAAYRDASSGALVEGNIPRHVVHKFLHGNASTGHGKRTGIAHLGAATTLRAQRTIDGDLLLAIVYRYRRGGALIDAPAAAVASTASIEQLRTASLGLRAVAPEARERTSFEKNRGTDARPIVGGEAINVEHETVDNTLLRIPPVRFGLHIHMYRHTLLQRTNLVYL